MKRISGMVAIVGLALSLLPAFFVFAGELAMDVYKQLMLAGTVLWFIAGTYWFRNRSSP